MGSFTQPTQKGLATPTHITDVTSLLSSTSTEIRDPSHPRYGASIQRWSRAAEKPAGLALVPTTAHEVSLVVKYATENNLDLAIRGGGHSTAGASSTNGGLLIDLSRMSSVRVDSDKNLLYVGGGATWGQVDNEAWKHGLATVGGTVSDTGVGGLALGGGYGWLSGQHGLTIDNIVEVEMVLADGRVVRCSEREESDLFWAVRGAGQNFGVATEFVIQAYPQSEIWGGFLGFPSTHENISKVVSAINQVYRSSASDSDSFSKQHFSGRTMGLCGFMSPPPANGAVMLMCATFFVGSEDDAKIAYKPFFDIGPVIDTTGVHPWPVANTLLVQPHDNLRSSMKGCGFKLPLRAEFVQEMGDEFVKFLDVEKDAGESLVVWEFFDPGEMMKKQDNGCFANRGWHCNGLVAPIWTNPENDDKFRIWARELAVQFQDELDSTGVPHGQGVEGGSQVRGPKGAVITYGNYDQHEERARDIFGDNYPRLQRLKAKYDPGNIFNKLFAIVPDAGAS